MASGISPEMASGSGLARRRQRISDEETARRMLAAATEMVGRSGLTVSLEHIRLEDVIRDAGVSRSAVYRRWPYKDLFFSDLLRELAAGAGSGTLPPDEVAADTINQVAAEYLDRIGSAESRHELVTEIIRRAGLRNFEFFHGSAQWRTYVALHATFLSLPEGELREDVRDALTRSEENVVRQIASGHEYVARLLGYRIRPELGADFTMLGQLLNAVMRGMVLMAPTVPDLASRELAADLRGTGNPVRWSQPALAIATTVLSFLEPDPGVDWTPEHVAAVREELAAGGFPGR